MRIMLAIESRQQNCILGMQLPRFNTTASCAKTVALFLLVTLIASDRLASPEQSKAPLPAQSPLAAQLPEVAPITVSFAEFKSLYGKQYSSVSQESYRQQVFRANLKRLNQHNCNRSRTYNMKANDFLDVTSSEFKEHFTGTYHSDYHSRNVSNAYLHQREREGEPLAASSSSKQRDSHHYNRSKYAERNVQGTTSISEIEHTAGDESADLNSSEHRLLISGSGSQGGSEEGRWGDDEGGRVEIDWSIYAGAIKYQGFCGACYAFTAVDTLAAMNAINKFSFFVSLSVQQVIDCSTNGLTFGCSGGYLEGAFTYIQLNGVTSDQAYPYTSANTGRTGKCQQEGGSFRLTSFNSIAEGDCSAVIRSLSLGPVSAGIAGYNLQFYDSGIFNDCNSLLDHAVVIVGFKSGFGWRIKNSWGVKWGDGGFGWIAEGNTCGICNMAVSIVV